ncbi:MAG: isochorismatase [Synechococcales cyanobacterium T60_A2020_003]|nr:isochorismatase [Synechococcales cyanobacterium T60_A2020_003]
MSRSLPIPPHFDPRRVSEVWRVPYADRAAAAIAWAQAYGIKPAAEDKTRICLLATDVQNTFCIPEFELFVGGRSGRGAVEDNVRLCEFIYRNLGWITAIAPTMDTHTATQIFHPVFWMDAAGQNPPPMTMISVEDVEQGKWRVNPAIAHNVDMSADELQAYALHYVRQLQGVEKYQLTIWPYHSILGEIGHALVSAVEEACFFHSIARVSQTRFEIKGSNPLTEHYSVLSPEVVTDQHQRAIAQKNTKFLKMLLEFDAILIAGQAKSHCVAWTIDDLLTNIQGIDPSLSQKIYLLDDCTSPVVVPGVVDFTDIAEAAYQRFAAAGVHRVRSTTPLQDWLGLQF